MTHECHICLIRFDYSKYNVQSIYKVNHTCPQCKDINQANLIADKKEYNYKNGIISESKRKSCRKAHHSRIINMYKNGLLNDNAEMVEKAHKWLLKLKERSKGRYAYVNRKIKGFKANYDRIRKTNELIRNINKR